MLSVIAISSPVNAETFTLAELVAGESFTVGGITFSNWIFDFEDSTVNPANIDIETINSPNLPGFRVFGNNELVGDEQKLIYGFSVSSPDAVMAGALLWLTDYVAQPLEDVEFDINLKDESVETGLEVEVGVGADVVLLDAEALSDAVPALLFEANVTTDTQRDALLAVNTYETRIILLAQRQAGLGFLPAIYQLLLLDD